MVLIQDLGKVLRVLRVPHPTGVVKSERVVR